MSRRFLCDLKVAELRNELEKRGVDKSGVKPILMERLREVLLYNLVYFQIILKEGYDPMTFNFKKSSNPGAGSSSDGRSVKVDKRFSLSKSLQVGTSGGGVAVGKSNVCVVYCLGL